MLGWPEEPGSFPALTTLSLSRFLFSWGDISSPNSNRISCQSRTNSCFFRVVCCAKTMAGLSLKGAMGWFLCWENVSEDVGLHQGLEWGQLWGLEGMAGLEIQGREGELWEW